MPTTFTQVGILLLIVGVAVSTIGYGAIRGWFPLPLSAEGRLRAKVLRQLTDEQIQFEERGQKILILILGLMTLLLAVMLLVCGPFIDKKPQPPSLPQASKISASVSSQAMQPSVIETP